MITPPVPKAINRLLLLGAVAVTLLIVFVIATLLFFRTDDRLWDFMNRPNTSGVTSDPQQLGQLGSACGGPERYPCIPGTLCTVPSGATYGTCTTDPAGKAKTSPADVGEACDDRRPCLPGLECQGSPNAPGRICVSAGAGAHEVEIDQ